jgi:uncharacterized protein involved in outer membrane biogenesis
MVAGAGPMKKMSGGHRWATALMIAGALLVVLVLAAAMAIPRLTDVNRYRSTIEAKVAERLGRPVTLGRMELSAFPQLSAVIHDVQVGGQGVEGSTVLRASTVRARAELLPFLLSRRLQLTAIALEEPEIVLVRSASGQWNWAEILERRTGESSARMPAPSSPSGSSGEQPSLTVEDLVIARGAVRVIDEAVAPGRSVVLNVAPLDLELKGYRAGRPFHCRIEGMLSGEEGRGALEFDGRVGPLPTPFAMAGVPVEGALEAESFPLRAIEPYVRSERGIRSLSGAMTTDLQLAIRPGSELEAKGSLKLDRVLLALGGDAPRSGMLDFDASLDVSSRHGGKDLTIRECELKSSGGQISLQGRRSSSAGGDQVALKVKGNQVRISDVAPLATLAGIDLHLDAIGAQPFDIEGEVETEGSEGSSEVRRLVLRDVLVRGIEAALYRNAGGSWSVGRTAAAPQAAPPQAVRTRTEIHDLRIEDANVVIQDAAAGHGRPVPLRLTDLDLKVDRFGTGSAGHGSLSANIDGGGRIDCSGTVGPETNGQLPMDAKVRLDDAKVSHVRQYLTGIPGFESGAGIVDLDVSIRGRAPERLALNGKLGLREGAIALPKPGGGTDRQALECDATFDAISERGGERVTLTSCKVSLPSGTFALSGSLDRSAGGKVADITLAPTRVRIEDLQAFASLVGVAFPGVMESPEPVAVAARIRGDLADRNRLQVEGSLKTTKLTWQTPYLNRPLENVDAAVTFAGNGLEAKPFSATLGKTTLRGELAIRNFGSPEMTFAITSDRADLSELLSAFSSGSKAGAPSPASPQQGATAKMRGRGTIAIGSGTFQTFAFSDLRSTVSLEGGVLGFAPLDFALYGGKYGGESEIDLRSGVPVFKHRCSLSGVDVNDFLSANTNFKDGLHGTLSGRLDVNGRGNAMDDVLRSLDGTGDIRVTDGRFPRVSMLKGLSQVTELFGERTLNQISQKASANDTPFSVLMSTFRASGGRVTTDNLVLKSEDFSFIAKGGFGFDRRLQLQGQIVFAEAISRSLREERSRAVYLGEQDGLVAIPVAVGGTIDRPSFDVDFGAAAGYAIGKSITDRIAEAFTRRERATERPSAPGQPSSPDPQPSAPGGQPSSSGAAGRTDSARSPVNAPVPPPAAPSAPADKAAPLDLRARVDEHGLRGSLLAPSLAIRGVVSGSRLGGLLVVVLDDSGREVHRATLLRQEIAAAYGKRPHDERVTVPFNVLIPANRLPHLAKWFKVQLAAVSEDGKTGPPVAFVERKAPAQVPGN